MGQARAEREIAKVRMMEQVVILIIVVIFYLLLTVSNFRLIQNNMN